VSEFKKINLLKHLRILVICFDNFSDERKDSLSTASEIVKNREWLVKVSAGEVGSVDSHEREVYFIKPFSLESTQLNITTVTSSSSQIEKPRYLAWNKS